MATTSNRAYRYPLSTDNTQIWTHVQNLATDVDTDVNAIADSVQGAWATYGPLWQSSGTLPAIGNGTNTGRRRITGKMIAFYHEVTWGSTTTGGTGTWLFNTPGMALATSPGFAFSAHAIDSGGNRYTLGCELDNTNRYRLWVPGGTSFVGATAPFTWGTGDILRVSGVMEVA